MVSTPINQVASPGVGVLLLPANLLLVLAKAFSIADLYCLVALPTGRLFHFCSHGSRDVRDHTNPWLEGPHALRQRLSPRNQIYEALPLAQRFTLRR